jgi:putative flippase GtrA
MNDTEKKKSTELLRTIKFVLFSASAGIIEAGLFALLTECTGWSYWPRYLIALVASVLWNFTLNRRYTFRSDANIPKAMFLVALFYLVFTPLTTIGGNFLAEDLGWNDYLVTALNMILNLVTEYLYDRFVVYRETIDSLPAKKPTEQN